MTRQTPPTPSPNPRMRDHVFVSYSHQDRALVERLASDVRDHGFTVWIDFSGIRPGEKWRQEIADAIDTASLMFVMLTPDSVASDFVKLEIETANRAGKKIIPLLLRPLKTDEDLARYNALAPDFSEIQYCDFTAGYEAGLAELLKHLPRPQAGIPGHCDVIVARLAALPGGMDHYIKGDAKLLPVHASPYDEGVMRGESQKLVQRLRTGTRTIVLGEPGIGKSVALERLAWELATGEPCVVPILIPLLRYKGEKLLEWLRRILNEPRKLDLRTTNDADDLLRDKRYEFYILLDGLNEVPPDYRKELIKEILWMLYEYPQHRVAITSRVQDELWRELSAGTEFDSTLVVQPITDADAQGYLSAHLGEGDGTRLWGMLDSRMRELSHTPLLLWLIKDAYVAAKAAAGDGEVHIPDNRGALYRDFVIRLLARERVPRAASPIAEEERMASLERLALAMHREKLLTIDRRKVVRLIGPEVTSALLANGLLTGEVSIRFAPHQTMQEHFAARAIEDGAMGVARAKGLSALARRIGFNRGDLKYARDPWWWETFVQLAGLVNDGNVLALALAEIDPWLAWWCFEETGKMDEQARIAIGNRAQVLVYSRNPRERRSALYGLLKTQNARSAPHLAHLAVDDELDIAIPALTALHDYGEDGAKAFAEKFEAHVEKIPLPQRAEYGRAIADLDVRSGIGVKNGVPDIVWCRVPAGAFRFGEGDQEQHLSIDYDYWIAKYPVTYSQYEAFVNNGGYTARWRHCWTDDGWWWKGDKRGPEVHWNEAKWHVANHPVVGVTWYEAVAFAAWLNEMMRNRLGHRIIIRLPTEGEWEKAARYPDGRRYPWGDKYISGYANINEKKDNSGKYYLDRSTAVGLYPSGANPIHGAHDLIGNVWEWCLTQWSNQYIHPGDNNTRVGTTRRCLRGGSWYYDRNNARATFRDVNYPHFRNYYGGFRLVALSTP